jgi:DNA-binding CsgD family transcriptional regulator
LLGAVLDRLEQGVVLVGAHAEVLRLNPSAREIVAARRGLGIAGGVLHAAARRETALLHQAIAAAARAGTGAGTGAARDHLLSISDPAGGPPLAAAVVALPPEAPDAAGTGGRTAAVFVADPARPARPSARQLRERFGLTAAEAALAIEAAEGDGLPACARRLGICPTTARTHLGHVFEKTGARRQAELVRLLLGLGLGLRSP